MRLQAGRPAEGTRVRLPESGQLEAVAGARVGADGDTIRCVLQKDASCLREENQLEKGTLEAGRLLRGLL